MTQTDKEKLEAIEWEMSFVSAELELFDESEHRSLTSEWKILYRIREILEK